MNSTEKLDYLWSFLTSQQEAARKNVGEAHRRMHQDDVDTKIDTGTSEPEIRFIQKKVNSVGRDGFQGIYWSKYLFEVLQMSKTLHDACGLSPENPDGALAMFLGCVRKRVRDCLLYTIHTIEAGSYKEITRVTEHMAVSNFYGILFNHHELGFALF